MLNWVLGGDDDEERAAEAPSWCRSGSASATGSCSSRARTATSRLPLPLGPNVLFSAGRALAEIGTGALIRSTLRRGFLASTVSAFNPVGGGLPSMDVKG